MPYYKCYSCMKTFGLGPTFRRVEEGGYCPYCQTMISALNLLGPGAPLPFNVRRFDIVPRPLRPAAPRIAAPSRAPVQPAPLIPVLPALDGAPAPRLAIEVALESSPIGRMEARITLSRVPAEQAFPRGWMCTLGVFPRDSGARLSIDEPYCFEFVRRDGRLGQTTLELDDRSPARWAHHVTVPPIAPNRDSLKIVLHLFDHRRQLVQSEIVRLDAGFWLMAHHLLPVCEVLVMQRVELRGPPPPPMPSMPPLSSAPIASAAVAVQPRPAPIPQLVEDPVQAAYHAALLRALPYGVTLTRIRAQARDLWVRDMFFAGNMIEPTVADLTGPVVIENPSVRGTEGEALVKQAVAQHISARYTYEQSLPAQGGLDTASSGNFLCCPPTDACLRGCILVGSDRFTGPMDIADFAASRQLGAEIVEFLGSHHAQPVMAVDTSWLKVGHVDELITFIPWAGSRLRFKAAVLSHGLAMELLDASGRAPILDGVAERILSEHYAYLPRRRSDEVLGRDWVHGVADLVRDRTRALKEGLAALGFTKDDIIDLPVLCKLDSPRDSAMGAFMLGGRFKEGCKFVTPNVVNMLVVTRLERSVLCIPKPYGPATERGCAFELHIRAALAGSGCVVEFIDDLEACHVNAGNVHCSTLELRIAR
jgi:hypothetical protein